MKVTWSKAQRQDLDWAQSHHPSGAHPGQGGSAMEREPGTSERSDGDMREGDAGFVAGVDPPLRRGRAGGIGRAPRPGATQPGEPD